MKESTAQNLLSARCGERRVTIGLDAPETLRRLSDARALTCPGCGAIVVLHAGTVRAHHFAHLPGAVCSLPQTEPETEEHRAGKLLIARWLRERLADAEIIVEAFIAETRQRADVLALLPDGKRIAFEFQCAPLSARAWRRRHRLYREAGLHALWLLGGSRLKVEGERTTVILRTTELERVLLWEGMPLLFLDATGERLPAETLVRFRPAEDAQAHRAVGRLVAKPLWSLPFPWALLKWALLKWPLSVSSDSSEPDRHRSLPSVGRALPAADGRLWEWLQRRFQVTPPTLPAFFGLPIAGQEAFACEARTWQAAVYYRFVHRRVGDGWWLAEVEAWAWAHLPLTHPHNGWKVRAALATYQEILAAAGFLSLPMGYNRAHARILADLTTLPAPPDAKEALRLARYRRTLIRENGSAYHCQSLFPVDTCPL